MMNKLKFIFLAFAAGIILFAGCKNVLKLSLDDAPLDDDLSGGVYRPLKSDSLSALADAEGDESENGLGVIYGDEWPNGWGFEKNNCKDFSFSNEDVYEGKTALKLNWNKKGDCPFIGIGGTWTNWAPVDMEDQVGKLALSMYIKNVGEPVKDLSIILGFEDYAEKNTFVSLNHRFIDDPIQNFDNRWVHVAIPMVEFNFAKAKVAAGNLKQIKMNFEGVGNVYIDDIRFIKFEGEIAEAYKRYKDANAPAKAATNKDGSANPSGTITLFKDELPAGAWGVDKDNCKEVAVIQSDKFEGTSSIAYSWNKTNDCKYISWGFSWTDWVPADISAQVKNGALQMRVKNLGKPDDGLPMVIGLEDYAQKGSYLALSNMWIPTDEYINGWNKVIIPLSAFDFAGHGVNPQSIKQIQFQGEGSANLVIDDIKIAPYAGKADNPHNKRDISLETVSALDENADSIGGVFTGVFMPGRPVTLRNQYATVTGRKPASVMWYEGWNDKFKSEDIARIHASGCIPHIVWEAKKGLPAGEEVNLASIINGKYDDYLQQYAEAAAKAKGTVQLRIFHEFNGNWYPWSTVLNGKEAGVDRHKKAWKHIVDIFRKAGAKNVQFVWCMNNGGVPSEKDNPWNDPYLCYPGDDYVDWVSIDGYNWGENDLPGQGSWWGTFREVFGNHYIKMAKAFPNKPLQIGEFACNEKGGDKAQWILDMQDDLKRLFPRIKNYNYFYINKEVDWRVNSNPKAAEAWKQIMLDPYTRSSYKGLTNVPAKFKDEFPNLNDIQVTEARIPAAAKRDERLRIKNQMSRNTKRKSATMTVRAASQKVDGVVNTDEYTGQSILVKNSSFRVSYDNEAIYLAGEVTDEDPLENKNENGDVWNGDAIEFALGLNTGADSARASLGEGDYHIIIKATAQPYVYSWAKASKLAGANVKTTKTADGYSIEARIPYAELGAKPIKAGTVITAEIAIDNGDMKGRKSQIYWNSEKPGFNERPFMWGHLNVVE
ncbi:MAG: sugar-binding protein [Bacteroidota bacterium]